MTEHHLRNKAEIEAVFASSRRVIALMRSAHKKLDTAFTPGGLLDDPVAVTFTKAESALVLAALEAMAETIGEELA